MLNSQQKTGQDNDDEINIIKEIAKPFWVNSLSEKPPKFVTMTGGTGSGKTTIRRQKYGKDYVNFDFGEILSAVKNIVGEHNDQLTRYAVLTCALILEISIEAKKNIVIEIIGDKKELIVPVIEGMKKIGYDVSSEFISCDPAEAYKRHLNAVKEDKDYISSYFTQDSTLHFLYQKLGLGEMPVSDPL
ncbi:hypothetical protein KKG19_05465 [Patescibacteria group bacterium]|nr:hypothetical protein [Patescibacteria group bacterium]